MKPCSSVSVSTTTLPLDQRSNHWVTNINRHLIKLDACGAPASGIEASLKQYDLGEVTLNHICSTAHGVQRNSTNISHDGREKIMLSLMLDGEGIACQGLQGSQQMTGDIVIYNSAYPYALAFPNSVEMMVVALPRQLLIDQLGKWEQKNLIKLDRNLSIGGYSTTDFFNQLSNYYAGHTAANSTVDLMLESLNGIINQHPTTSANKNLQNLLSKSKKWIAEHLHEEDLTIEKLSFNLHTSSRQLARAFALEGNTVSRYIWNRRLEKCRKDISNIKNNSNLSEIAFRWGFNHAAHFSRSYKQYFGESPTETRKKTTLKIQ